MSELLDLVGVALRDVTAYHAPPDPLPIKLDANESPWPLPDEVRGAIAERVAELSLHRYPDMSARALRAAIAQRVGARDDELLLGVGSDEAIAILLSALDRPRHGQPRATALFPTPSFVMYGISARVHGHDPIAVPLQGDWSLDLDAVHAAIERHDPNVIFLATPNNPTGNAFDDAALESLVAAAPRALVVIDEAYAPFAGRSLSGWVDRFENVAVMGTLSKIGLAGLRVGWIRARPALTRELNKARPPYNLPSPSQVIATEVLTRHAGALEAQVQKIVEERARVIDALTALDSITPHPSRANFVLARVADAGMTHEALRRAGIAVRRFKDPRLARHLRITIGTPDENDQLLAALAVHGTL